jgi:hypothetical protein
MNHKLCPRCGEVKSTKEFGANIGRHDGLQVYCLPCAKAYRNTDEFKARQMKRNKAWYAKHAEQEREKALERYYANPDPVRAKRRKINRDPAEYARHVADVLARAREHKARVFAYYGTSCECCGESNPGFLTIDHINGCTKEERKSQGNGSGLYRWLCNNGFPEGFRTMCYNCNYGRASNLGGVCPHKLKKVNKNVYHRRTKAKVFAHYGRQCVCCGESNPGFLSIDHMNGCGNELRKVHGNGGRLYRWLINNGFPEGFQTQCLNCNVGRAHNGGICPHKTGSTPFVPVPLPPDDDVFRLTPNGDFV